jgi:hypothetical protein
MFCADMMSNQEKFKRLQETTRAQKAKEVGNSVALITVVFVIKNNFN